MTEKRCTRCGVVREMNFFVGQNSQITKTCSGCRETGRNLHKKNKDVTELMGMIQCSHCRHACDPTDVACPICGRLVNLTQTPIHTVKPSVQLPPTSLTQQIYVPPLIRTTISQKNDKSTQTLSQIDQYTQTDHTILPSQPIKPINIKPAHDTIKSTQPIVESIKVNNLLKCNRGHHEVPASNFIDERGKTWSTCNHCREQERLRKQHKRDNAPQ